MGKEPVDEHREWYLAKRPAYEGLSDIVRSTLESLLKNARIDYLSVSCRTKTLDSFLEKLHRKEYNDPKEDNTDFSGVRVIAYIESDVTKVCELIRRSFKVYPKLSFDKSEELGVDRFGYRSVHFVCDLGSDRVKLPEFELYSGLKFEIQVRTVLQHAWAEIEHDRNYKFSGILPTPLRRRLYSLAGLLEIVDREFVALSSEVDEYSEDVARKTKAGNLDVEVNTTSLLQFLPNKFSELQNLSLRPLSGPTDIELVTAELRDYGVKTLGEVNALFTQDFWTSVLSHERTTTYTGLLRSAMMYADIDRYFELAWNQHWTGFLKTTYQFLAQKYGEDRMNELIKNKELELMEGRRIRQRKTRKKP